MSNDQIEKSVLLKTSRSRVWAAISDADAFGSWFGVLFDGPFQAGTAMHGAIRPTTVDPVIAEAQKPYEGKSFEFLVEQIEPEQLISFRWHPFAIDPNVDYSQEATTLIVFTLREDPEGVLLTVTESGFDQIPIARREEAFEMNSQGWSMQMSLIEKYLAK